MFISSTMPQQAKQLRIQIRAAWKTLRAAENKEDALETARDRAIDKADKEMHAQLERMYAKIDRQFQPAIRKANEAADAADTRHSELEDCLQDLLHEEQGERYVRIPVNGVRFYGKGGRKGPRGKKNGRGSK